MTYKLTDFYEEINERIKALEKKFEDGIGSDNVWMANTMEEIKELKEQIAELKEMAIEHRTTSNCNILRNELKERFGKLSKGLEFFSIQSSDNREVLRDYMEIVDVTITENVDGQSLDYYREKKEELLEKLDSKKIHGWTKETWKEYQKRLHEGYPMIVKIGDGKKTEKKDSYKDLPKIMNDGTYHVIDFPLEDSGGEKESLNEREEVVRDSKYPSHEDDSKLPELINISEPLYPRINPFTLGEKTEPALINTSEPLYPKVVYQLGTDSKEYIELKEKYDKLIDEFHKIGDRIIKQMRNKYGEGSKAIEYLETLFIEEYKKLVEKYEC